MPKLKEYLTGARCSVCSCMIKDYNEKDDDYICRLCHTSSKEIEITGIDNFNTIIGWLWTEVDNEIDFDDKVLWIRDEFLKIINNYKTISGE